MGVKVVEGRSVKFKQLGGFPEGVIDAVGVVSTSEDNPNYSIFLVRVVNLHLDDIPKQDEVYYVLDGEGTITCGRKTNHFHKGDVVIVAKGTQAHWDIEFVSLVGFAYPPIDKAYPELGEADRRPEEKTG